MVFALQPRNRQSFDTPGFPPDQPAGRRYILVLPDAVAAGGISGCRAAACVSHGCSRAGLHRPVQMAEAQDTSASPIQSESRDQLRHRSAGPVQLSFRPHLSLIHISEPTRRTPISYAVFCLKKKKKNNILKKNKK